MSEQRFIVFTDGSAKVNPGPGGWGVIIVTPGAQVVELGGGAAPTTNNKMELTGAIEALQFLRHSDGGLDIYTDSTYVIKGIRDWVWGWRRRGWKTAAGTDVLNRDLWERLSEAVGARAPKSIEWHYVRGHVGTPGNERADEIADAFALNRAIDLYRGPLDGYPRPILDRPSDTSVPKRSSTSAASGKSKARAYSYLSVVDGLPMRHATWAECERRVKGRSGTLFKKAASREDEMAILRGWQFDPNAV